MADNALTRPLQLDLANTVPMGKPGEPGLVANRLGRFIVLDVLGRGGMGIVYAAYDPVLDRRIALKLLLELEGDDATAGRARMHREAQALARLSHPNVITVHDVGEHDRAMYIAMELVQGKTLRDWQVGRRWREVLGAYAAAARGLAAAHAAGLVHRDFKPENVLVGDDGRVRVTDFGLARLAGGAPVPATPASPSQLAANLTAAGAVMGTLAYMAPEQIDGGSVDERSDQCSWCIAAWEALYGAQPFVSGPAAVRSAAMKADAPAPPETTEVPRGVARALARGLAPDPDRRWPSMTALADELARVASPRRRWAWGAAAAMIVIAIAAVFVAGRRSGAAAPDCRGAGAPIDGLWAPAVRAEVERAFAATGAPFAAGALTAVDRRIGGFRDRWRQLAVESCEATRVHGTQSAHVLDLRTACLMRARNQLAITIGALGHADRKRVEQAPTLAPPELDACDDVAVLQGEVPPPRDDAGRRAIEAVVEPIERQLEAGVSLDGVKPLEPALAAQIAAAERLGWPPLVARTRRDLARAQADQGHGTAARVTLLAAAAAASAAGDPDALTDLYLALADGEARLTSDFALGERWVELAAGTLARLGPRPAKQIAVDRARGYVAERAGRPKDARAAYGDALGIARVLGPVPELETLIDLARVETDLDDLAPARQHLDRARQLARSELGASHPMLARIDHDLGTIQYRAGDHAGSRASFEAALAVRRAAYGDDSVEAANTVEALGNADLALDRVDDARREFEQAIRVLEARLGPQHPDVANAYNDLGGALHRAGLYPAALANAQKVLALREKALGPGHPDVGQSLVNLAIEAKNLGRWDLVDASYPRALAIFEQAYGKDSLDVAALQINLGEAQRARGSLDAAAAAYDRARELMTPKLGEAHPMLAHVWNGLGQVELARGRADLARPLLERAVAMREHSPGDATDLAESRFALCRALPAPDHARAVQLATAARDAYRDAGPGYAARFAAVEAWLKQP
ncbi:MAG TPA: serine/threonine-protein kinase [Kofleriaceae bacterium]|nr:serine/threonine-protein kinase [Kofleriaceae bacterium]